MRLTCPFCGERSTDEFVYLGSAEPVRPGAEAADAAWTDYVFVRANPAGPNREYWHHTHGCRSWLAVTRDTRTHEVLDVATARADQAEAGT
ncbi:MAG: sarcosine oxidase subunit delta [Vicinamibacterales bacterium]